MDEEIIKRIEACEKRLDALEAPAVKIGKKAVPNADYKGLAGGIRFIMNNGFLNEPKTVKEILRELKRENYTCTESGVSSTLSKTFTKSQKLLTRTKEDSVYKYVVRK